MGHLVSFMMVVVFSSRTQRLALRLRLHESNLHSAVPSLPPPPPPHPSVADRCVWLALAQPRQTLRDVLVTDGKPRDSVSVQPI